MIGAGHENLVTADLHYDISRSREPVMLLARRTCASGGDAAGNAGGPGRRHR